MNRESLKRETNKWMNKGIISNEQKDQILSLYPKRNIRVLLLIFASVFIGLGFLTFIASNWSWLPDIAKMSIIIFFMLGFYFVGENVYRHRSTTLGISLIMIGLFVFGAGIFLTGQMYNYMYFQATPFVIWAIAGFLLFVAFQHAPIYVIALVITTAGQLYSVSVYNSFNYWLLLLLLFGFSHFTYHQARILYSYLFAGGFVIHVLVFVFTKGFEYIWILIGMLILYLIGELIHKKSIKHPFRAVSLLSAFIWSIFHVFILNDGFYFHEEMEYNTIFLISWLVLFLVVLVVKWQGQIYIQLTEIGLFLPFFYVLFGDMLSVLSLFIFSIGFLLYGYQEEDTKKVNIGTAAFLFSTSIAYVHFAWAFLDKSLFFFVGGILLFALSYFLERKRRRVKRLDEEGKQR